MTTFRPDGGDVVLALDIAPGRFDGAAVTIEKSFVTAPTAEPSYAGTV